MMAVQYTRILFHIKENVQRSMKAAAILSRFVSDIQSNRLIIRPTDQPRKKPSNSRGIEFGRVISDHMLAIEWTKEGGWNSPQIVPFGPIAISPSASVLHYGLEVFEGMKAYRSDNGDALMFRPDQNIERFHRSSIRMSLPEFDKEELLKCIVELVRLDQDWIPEDDSCSLYIRPTSIATESSLGVRPPESAMMFCITGPVGPYFPTGTLKPVSLLADPQFVRAWPGGIGDCKAGGNYGPTIFSQKVAQAKGCQQCLWLYKDEVTEVGTMNIFMYWINENGEKELITPTLNGLILPGITRLSLLELAREWDEFKVTERSFTIQELMKGISEGRVKEIFGAGTACVVCPVEKILYRDKMIDIGGDSATFPLTRRFFKELTDIQYGRREHHWSYLVDSPQLKQVKHEN